VKKREEQRVESREQRSDSRQRSAFDRPHLAGVRGPVAHAHILVLTEDLDEVRSVVPGKRTRLDPLVATDGIHGPG
jgi:hypothetical protein